MTKQFDIQAIEANIKQAKELAEFGTVLARLRNSKDYKKIIVEGYFEKEAVRLVHLKSDPNMQSAASQESIIKQMDAIGALNQYLQVVEYRANAALSALDADEATLTELLTEDIN